MCLKKIESREDCLRLLRHLLHRLKERDDTFSVFSSYLTKTTLLHACCSRNHDSDWRTSQLGRCFMQLVDDFVGHLERGELLNFFIPTQNLLSGIGRRKRTTLIRQIREEGDNGFPLLQWIFFVCLFQSKKIFSYAFLFIVQIASRCLWLWFSTLQIKVDQLIDCFKETKPIWVN